MSGKGGVGKTTVAVNLAYYLADNGNVVGILDADVHGPNVLKLMGIDNQRMGTHDNKLVPIYATPNLRVSSLAGLVSDESAIIWRGPLKHKALSQLINDTEWGDLDYLIVDFPPGTGDELISIAQFINGITGAVIVSTPQHVSLLDMGRAIDFCRKMNIKIIGLIENMSGDIFGKGTVKDVCDSQDIPFLGMLPLNRKIVQSGEDGIPFYHDNDGLRNEFNIIVQNILKNIENKEEASLSEDSVMTTLSKTIHPEIDYSLTDLGMIKHVNVKNGTVSLVLLLPFLNVPVKDDIISLITNAIKGLDNKIKVDITIEEMNDSERQQFMAMAQKGWKDNTQYT